MRGLSALIAVGVTALCFLVLFGSEAWPVASVVLSQFPTTAILLYAALSVLSLSVRAVRYQIILRGVAADYGIPTKRELLFLTAIRNMFVDFLPARIGELSYFPVMSRLGITPKQSLSTFGVSFALDIFVLLAIFAGFVGVSHVDELWIVLVIFGVLLSVSLFGIVLGLPFLIKKLRTLLATRSPREGVSERSQRLYRLTEGLLETTERVYSDLQRLWTSGNLAGAICCTVILRGVKYYSLYLLYCVAIEEVLGERVILPALSIVTAFVLAEGASSLPIGGVMGFGSYEATMSAFLLGAGVRLDGSMVYGVSFSIHIITQVVGYSIGVLALAVFPLIRRTRRV